MPKHVAAVLAVACLVGAATQAQAQSLYMVSVGDSGLLLAERDTLRWRDGRPQIVHHLVFTTPLAFEKDYGVGYNWAQGLTTTAEFDCATRRYRAIDFQFFSFSQSSLGKIEGEDGWQTFDEGSDLEAVQALACKNTLPSDTHFPSVADAAFIFYEVVHNPDEE